MESTLAYPSADQLIDLFNWASPGMAITTGDGKVVFANKAATELLGDHASKGANLPQALGINDFSEYQTAGAPVENIAAAFENPHFPVGYANVGFAAVEGADYAFWALRPVTSLPTPSPQSTKAATSAQAWISQVDGPNDHYQAVGEEAVPLIQAYYDTCPVAIHLIEEDGTVAYANWKDVALVGATSDPTSYVGGHIRHIYADQPVVDDFLGRWGEDAPIIDFRADFLDRSKGNERVPVVIFSTAKVEDNKLKNTRCFVFSDSHPGRERNKVKALDLNF